VIEMAWNTHKTRPGQMRLEQHAVLIVVDWNLPDLLRLT